MVVLGVLLLVVVVVVAVSIVAGGSGTVMFTLLGMDFETTARYVYLAGLASLLVAVLGVALVMRGMRRQRQIRRENKSLRREVRAVHETDGQHAAPREDAASRTDGPVRDTRE